MIVTNGRVTTQAVAFAKQQRLHVIDRHTLGEWASGKRRTRFEEVMGTIKVRRAGPGRPRTRPDHVLGDKGYSSR
ncbi:hypothetical protein Slala03_80070 [Streptomyces lavendulae subsp. lavendulae]|nr:hypothetical protein Slala03_80070 [Streptomyces lavendulae subsp. lavendulae]